jgi:hypothetical protein
MKIKKFYFSIGGYFGTSHSIKYKKGKYLYRTFPQDEAVTMLIDPIVPENKSWDDIICEFNSYNEDLEISEERLLKFLNYTQRYCKNWSENYFQNVCDGTSWECDIWIDDYRLKSDGLESYPKNFKSFLNKLTIFTNGKIFE